MSGIVVGLVLVNPQKWDDPFENFFLRADAVDEHGNIESLDNLARKWYGQCWTLHSESDAMWRIYGPKKNGIRVSTTVRRLFSVLWDDNDPFRGLKYFIGRVSYQTRTKIERFMKNRSFLDVSVGGQNDNFAKLLLTKRTEFRHEAEVRLLVDDTDGTKGDKNGCYHVPFGYAKIFDDVCIDPRLEDTKCRRVVRKLERLGCSIPIKQSELYRVMFQPIRLS